MGEVLSRDVVEAVEQLMPYFVAVARQSALAADLLPDTTRTRDIGSTTKQFGTIYAENVKADLVEAARAIVEGIGPNFIKNSGFEQTEQGFTNQPRHWVLATEAGLGEAVEEG